jgi:hypothetical protein
MLSALLNRLRPKGPLPSPPPLVRPVVPRSPPLLAPTGAQRPLVSAEGSLAGFEFHAAAALRKRLDGAAASAYTANLLGAMRLCVTQGLSALAELPAGWLLRGALQQQLVPGMHLLLRADASCDDAVAVYELLARLRAAGVRVGWDPLAMPPMPAATGQPDFMPVRAPAGHDAPAWRLAIAAAAERWPGRPLLLLDLPAVELMEAVLGPPVLWATCMLGSCAEPARAQALPPQAQRTLRLLNRLLHDDDHAAVVEDIKADAALGLRLLHYLNSAAASPARELDSIEQAVLLLGRDALYRWVAQMVVRMAPQRPAAQALQATALARARLFELLARASEAPSPGGLYLFGLATMLPLLLQCGIDEAADALHLPPAAVQALRQQGGPWQPYLRLLQALEAADLEAVEALAAPFGGQQAVLACWAEAWQST